MQIDDKTLSELVTVLCSDTQCKFRRGSGYYTRCRNRCTLLHYREFAGGRLYVSDCRFCNLGEEHKIKLEEIQNDNKET